MYYCDAITWFRLHNYVCMGNLQNAESLFILNWKIIFIRDINTVFDKKSYLFYTQRVYNNTTSINTVNNTIIFNCMSIKMSVNIFKSDIFIEYKHLKTV